MAERYSFVQVDVFASAPLQGNPLAVFTDARGLTDAQMQAVAREMNLSETTFVLPDQGSSADSHRVRIFTVEEELPFAGHPTLGTAVVIRNNLRGKPVSDLALDLNVGKIPVTFRDDDEGTFAEMRQRDPEFGTIHDRDAVARAAGISPEAIDDRWPIQTVSTGVPFTIVPLRSLSRLEKLHFSFDNAAPYLEQSGGKFFYFVSRETVASDAGLHARMIFYGGEDPATGSAAGCCASWAVRHGVFASGENFLIEQGLEMQRPSRIRVRATRDGDGVRDVFVGGYVVEIAEGELLL